MRARQYNKRISLYAIDSVSDGIGGGTPVEVSLGNSWAKIETFKVPNSYQSADNDFLKNETGNAIKVTTRFRKDIPYSTFNGYLVYRGEKYKISTDSTNVNFMDNTVQFVAVREAKIGALNGLTYPAYIARANSAGAESGNDQCINEYIEWLS